MTPTSYRVVSRETETADTVTLTLAPDGRAIAAPRPGQFSMLGAFGTGEAPISQASTRGDRLLHTVRRIGAATTALHDSDVGDWVGVRGPYGAGWDLDRARGRDVLVIAGGLGLAPVRQLIEEVLADREAYGRLAVLVGARTPDDLIYRELLDRWQERDDLDLQLTVDAATASWRGHVGFVTELVEDADVDIAAAVAFVCGPEVMMRYAAGGVTALGGQPAKTFLSLERNMHCAIGHCGHCQLGPAFICKDGPVLDWSTVEPLLAVAGR